MNYGHSLTCRKKDFTFKKFITSPSFLWFHLITFLILKIYEFESYLPNYIILTEVRCLDCDLAMISFVLTDWEEKKPTWICEFPIGHTPLSLIHQVISQFFCTTLISLNTFYLHFLLFSGAINSKLLSCSNILKPKTQQEHLI